MLYFAAGLMFYLPFLDVCHIVDIRLKILKILPHAVISLLSYFLHIDFNQVRHHTEFNVDKRDDLKSLQWNECTV